MREFETDGPGQRIVFGTGSLSRLASELRRLGRSHALVLSTVGQRHLAERVLGELGPAAAGSFSGAVMHTPVEVTAVAVEASRRIGADSLVSIGGGSTTGLGKAIASRTGLPHVAVPTTYAGSEVTPVLGETEGGAKVTRSDPAILPETVIYDVTLSASLPWDVTVTSAVNAMAHAVEARYAADRTDASDHSAEAALAALVEGLRHLWADSASLDARDDLLYGAWLAGTCLGTVGMGLHHKLCHTLGGSFGLPHAPTHTVVLPYAMAYNEPAAAEPMAAIAGALGFSDAPTELQAFIGSLGAPTSLASLGFANADIPRAAELATARPYPNPRKVTTEGVTWLLTQATIGGTIGGHLA